MKRLVKGAVVAAAALTLGLGAYAMCMASEASDSIVAEDVIPDGVTIDGVDVSGMTSDEATNAINIKVSSYMSDIITLNTESGSVTVNAKDLGVSWKNEDVIDEAMKAGRSGNLIKRYKEQTELENGGIDFDVIFTADEKSIESVLEENESELNTEPVDYGLKLENGEFTVVEGTPGVEINMESSVEAILEFVEYDWSAENTTVRLESEVTQPQGSEEELARVKDVLGQFTTDYSSSAWGRAQNVANGCSKINGTLLYPGETFSVYEAVSPFEAENGYELAGSYENGTTVETYGGGICQVSTTLYNAVIRAELQVEERYCHSMIVSYVDPSADAAIAGTYKDFKFTNNTDSPVYIEGYTSGGQITFKVYGEETREDGRVVTFESETTSTTEPTTEYRATSDAIGYYSTVQSAHTGYTAELWKIVTVNGVEVSREKFNSSTYNMSPKIIEVGTGSSSSEATAAVKEAIATGNEDKILAAISANTAEALEAAEEEEKAAEEEKSKKDKTEDTDSDKKKDTDSSDSTDTATDETGTTDDESAEE